MKSILLTCLLVLTAMPGLSWCVHAPETGYSVTEKDPEKGIDYSRFSADGLYMVRVAVPHHDRQFDDEDQMKAQYSEAFAFKKVCNLHDKKLRIEGYTIRDPEVTPEMADQQQFILNRKVRHRPEGAFILVVEGDQVYYVYEKEKIDKSGKWTNVACCQKKVKWHSSNYLKNARYDKMTFTHNKLCNRYTNLDFGRHCDQKKGKCKIDYSTLAIDAFTHKPVEMFFTGRIARRQHGYDEEARSPQTHEMQFWSNVLIKRFHFGLEKKEEKELFKIPEKLKNICTTSHGMFSSDQDDTIPPQIEVMLNGLGMEIEN